MNFIFHIWDIIPKKYFRQAIFWMKRKRENNGKNFADHHRGVQGYKRRALPIRFLERSFYFCQKDMEYYSVG